MAEDEKASGGGGPDDLSRYPGQFLRIQGFISLVFCMALGLTLSIFFLIFRWGWITMPSQDVVNFVSGSPWNLLSAFAFGFVGGTLFSGFYNMVVVRRINLFGIDRMTN